MMVAPLVEDHKTMRTAFAACIAECIADRAGRSGGDTRRALRHSPAELL